MVEIQDQSSRFVPLIEEGKLGQLVVTGHDSLHLEVLAQLQLLDIVVAEIDFLQFGDVVIFKLCERVISYLQSLKIFE